MSLTNTTTSGVTSNGATHVIYHKGPNPKDQECSICREMKPSSEFKFYQQRVDKDGYLSRSNAHCSICEKTSTKERMETLKKATKMGKIPPKPKAGDICPRCDRSWPNGWHRDHNEQTHEFISWLCGNCNMSKGDHRMGTS